jgi:hypothetical protein
MGSHIFAKILAGQDRDFDDRVRSPIIGGASLLAVSDPDRKRFAASVGFEELTSDQAGTHFVALVTAATVQTKGAFDKVKIELNAAYQPMIDEGHDRAQAADHAWLTERRKQVEAVQIVIPRHRSVDMLDDQLAEYVGVIPFDAEPIKVAIAGYRQAQAEINDLAGIRARCLDNVDGARGTASSPAVLAALRAAGAEIKLAALIASPAVMQQLDALVAQGQELARQAGNLRSVLQAAS